MLVTVGVCVGELVTVGLLVAVGVCVGVNVGVGVGSWTVTSSAVVDRGSNGNALALLLVAVTWF